MRCLCCEGNANGVRSQAFGGEGTLLGRTHGRVVVTEAGQLFLTSCEAILSVASEACRALQDYRLVPFDAVFDAAWADALCLISWSTSVLVHTLLQHMLH